MSYHYEGEESYEGRVLWGRMAVYGVAFVLMFALGSCWGSRGAVDEDAVEDLQGTVAALREENEQLQEQIDALSAGERNETPTAQPAEPGEPEEPDGGDTAASRTYIVESGDTLTTIAREFYDDASQWELIAEANGLTRDTPLTVGQELVIPPLEDAGGDG